MKTDNKKLISSLGILGILETESIKDKKAIDSDSSIVTIINNDGEEVKVRTDSVSDTDVSLLIQTEQLATLKSIKSRVKFHTVLTVIGLCVAAILLGFLLTI